MAQSTLVFLLLLVAGCSAYKPHMTPGGPERIINEGDELIIKCSSITAFKIIFPETKKDDYTITSEHDVIYEENEKTGLIKQIFQRKSTVHGDSGWYGCVDESIGETVKGNFDDPNASWIYVYVKSDKHLFASNNEDVQLIYDMAGNTIILPCRPTSPELHVTLTFEFNPVELNDEVSFDPKTGFTMKNMSASGSGFYTCTIKEGDEERELLFSVTIHKPIDKLIPPVISTENLRSVTKGSELNVTCTAEVGTGPYMISWTTPRDNAPQKVYILPTQIIDEDKRLATSVLNIPKVTDDDEGEYVCKLEVHKGSTKTQTYITIHDPSDRFINLTSDKSDRLVQVDDGSSVTFVAHIEGYPRPSIAWIKHDPRRNLEEKIITSSPGVIVKNTETYTSLHMDEVHSTDAGVYIVEAFHNDSLSSTKRSNFTLEVRAKPSVAISDDDNIEFFSINQTANFSCSAYNNPPATVSIFYFKCPNYPMIMEDCQTIQVVSTTVKDTPTEKKIQVQFQTEKIGAVRCTACNKLGCDSEDVPLFLTDGVPNQMLGIISDLKTVTANANITFTCIAPIYNVSAVEWRNSDYEPIRDTDKMKVTFTDTAYTRRSILTIIDVHKSDEGDYFCVALNSDGDLMETITHHLEVHDFLGPVIKTTNVDGSKPERQVSKPHNIRLVSYPRRKSNPKYYLVQSNQQ